MAFDWNSAFNEGFNVGFNSGYSSGFNDGFNRGFDAGFQAGFNAGFNAGFQSAFNQAFNEGFNKGFDSGYNSGFNDGYSAAVQAIGAPTTYDEPTATTSSIHTQDWQRSHGGSAIRQSWEYGRQTMQIDLWNAHGNLTLLNGRQVRGT